MTCGKIVVNHNLISSGTQGQSGVGTDIAGTAGDEDLGHGCLLIAMVGKESDAAWSGIVFTKICQARRAPKRSSVLPFPGNFER
jgi:hypothetical protein